MAKPYWNQQIECLAGEELADLQQKKLPQVLKYLKEKSPFFGRKISESGVDVDRDIRLSDLQKIPFTTREELFRAEQQNPPFGQIPCVSIQESGAIGRSGVCFSITGQRLNVLVTHADIWRQGEGLSRALWAGGMRAKSHVYIAVDPRYNLLNVIFMRATADISALTVYIAAERSRRNARYTTQAIPPTHYFLTPTYSLYLADIIHEERGERLPIESIFGWGEPGFSIPGTREKIQKAWNRISSYNQVNLYEVYGSTEGGILAISCAEGNGMHCLEDTAIYEIIDLQSGKPARPGEIGELVITHLDCGGMPLLRYRTGDITSWIEGPCRCGRTHRKISALQRLSEMIHVGQKILNANQVENAFQSLTEKAANFRIVKESNFTTSLRLLSDGQGLPQDAENRLKKGLGVPVALELKPISELPPYIHRNFRMFEPGRKAFYQEIYAYQSQIE